ncbi:hypothetical protein B7486_77090, partial [cyanobacterium TDX16]
MQLLAPERLVFMGDPAIDISNNPLAIEGLDLIFEPLDTPGQDQHQTRDTQPQDSIKTHDTPGQDSRVSWTVEEASTHLGISSKTVLRRLQKGSLKGHKVAGQYGLEWRVTQDNPGQPTTSTQDRTGADNTEIIQLKTKLELMTDELKELKQQLQGASFRNGYLEAQLEG